MNTFVHHTQAFYFLAFNNPLNKYQIIPEIATLNTNVTHTQKGPYRSGFGLIDRLTKSVVSEGRGSIDQTSLGSNRFLLLNIVIFVILYS